MSVRFMSKIWDMAGLSPVEKLSLLALADWANDDGIAWPSIQQIADKTGCGKRTVQKAFVKAESMGILKRDHVSGKGCNYTLYPRTTCTRASQAPVHHGTQTPAPRAPNTSTNTIVDKANALPTKRPRKKSLKPDDVPDEIWKDWKAVRKRPVTASVLARIQTEADKLGWTLAQAITESAESGWQGFKADWVKENGRNNRNNGSSTERAVAGARARMASLKGECGSGDRGSGVERIGPVSDPVRSIGHVTS